MHNNRKLHRRVEMVHKIKYLRNRSENRGFMAPKNTSRTVSLSFKEVSLKFQGLL